MTNTDRATLMLEVVGASPERGSLGYLTEMLDVAEKRGEKKCAEELEKLRMQLAACGVAALQNTEATLLDRLPKENPYWSDSYQNVCNAVDTQMLLRKAQALPPGSATVVKPRKRDTFIPLGVWMQTIFMVLLFIWVVFFK